MGTLEIIRTSPECEIVTSRIVKAPRHLVYKAWTDPNHLKLWWGPKGFTNTFTVFDFRVGGRWSFIMHGPDKGNFANECTFVAIKEPELLVWDRQSKPIFQVEVTFEKVSDNETKVTFKQKFKTAEECNKIKAFAPEKNEENMDRLEIELEKM
jgi:uncharacterized protein YndB with AHSA1/START domain